MAATIEDVEEIVAALPDVEEIRQHGRRAWATSGRAFAWIRPFSKADLRRFAENDTKPPDGPILAVRVHDRLEKDAAIAANPTAFFTIPHFDGYAALLVELRRVTKRALRQALLDGHRACAAPRKRASGRER